MDTAFTKTKVKSPSHEALARAVTVRIVGGLGNQMFQYAAARALSLRCRAPLVLDLREFGSYTLRRSSLDRWKISIAGESSVALRRYPDWLLLLSRRFPALRALGNVYQEASLRFDVDFHSLTPPLHLSGYFQSERYFAHIRPTLLDDFVPGKAMSGYNKKLARLASSSNSVSVHVRRGDYVSVAANLDVHGVCSADYYQRALDHIRSRTRPECIFFFSDDLAWVQKNINVPEPAFYVAGNGDCPEVDIHLMTMCRHHVCANSSFSWWGAWLSTREDGLVVAPERWFANDKLDSTDLVPQSWIRL